MKLRICFAKRISLRRRRAYQQGSLTRRKRRFALVAFICGRWIAGARFELRLTIWRKS